MKTIFPFFFFVLETFSSLFSTCTNLEVQEGGVLEEVHEEEGLEEDQEGGPVEDQEADLVEDREAKDEASDLSSPLASQEASGREERLKEQFPF